MDEPIKEFLTEVCDILRNINDDDIESYDSDPAHLASLFPNKEDQDRFLSLMADDRQRSICIRLTRHAATAVAFHILVLFDERKELGKTGAWPKLSLVVDNKEMAPPTHLHELLGEAMQDLGMDTDEWW